MRVKPIWLALCAVLVIFLPSTGATAADTLNAIWVHGNVAEAEAPYNLYSTSPRGWGMIFTGKENTTNWFHLPVTTPVITENTRVQLEQFFVRFKTIGNCKITNLHVWDGKTRIILKDGLNLSGDHLSLHEPGINAFLVSPRISMGTGLEIAVGVQFGPKDSLGRLPAIQFSTAGADFRRFW